MPLIREISAGDGRDSHQHTPPAGATASPSPPGDSPSPGLGPRVLVVDDNAVSQKVTVQLLERLGHRADSAASGREAVAALGHIPYAVVLMDCRMPEMDGFEATKRIRDAESRSGRHTAIIAMTADAFQGNRECCRAAGMDDYLVKPVKAEELACVLARWIPTAGEQEPPTQPAAVQEARLLSPAKLLLRFGNAASLAEIATTFLDDCPRLMARIHAAVATRNAKQLELAAHTLKGAVSNFGASTVVEAAWQLEEMGRHHTLANAPAACAALENSLARLAPELAALRG